MKHFSLFLLLFIKWNFVQATETVYITGVIINIQNQVEVEDMSDLGKLSQPNLKHIFIPDSVGQFEISISLKNAGYYRIGRNILYLTMGDSLYVELDYMKPELANFYGKYSNLNNYLKYTPFPLAGSYLANKGILGKDISSTIKNIIDFAKKRERELLSLSKPPANFLFLETGRIRADIINSIVDIYYEYPMYHKLKGDSLKSFELNFKININELIRPYAYNFIDDRYLQLNVYQKLANMLLRLNNKFADTDSYIKINDWLKAEDYFSKINSAKNIDLLDSFYIKINQIKTKKYKEKLQLAIINATKYGNGSKVMNFNASTLDDKIVSLDQYKGKIIFIDLWATWCGPCIQAIPDFEKTKDKFKSDTNIVFLSLSIDENREKWKEYVSNKSMSQPQWIIDRLEMQQYNIVGIPRTIVIDKSFSIFLFYGPLPSDKKSIENLLEEMENSKTI